MSQPEPAARTCPICGKAQMAQHRPFCSRRCADIDLSRWLGGRYAIPVEDARQDEPPLGDADE